jgi:hypothetical protein
VKPTDFLSLLLAAPAMWAQAPASYSLTEINSMVGPKVTIHVWVEGNRALSEQDFTDAGKPVRSHSLHDLQSRKTYSWSPSDATVPCVAGTFGGDWGDPFTMSREMTADLAKQNAQETGEETIAGIPAKVMTVAGGKAWVDPKTGLLLKAQFGGQTIVEVTQFTPGKPPPSVFSMPASCASAAAPVTEVESADAISAIMPPASTNACAVTIQAAGATRLSVDGAAKALRNGEVYLAEVPEHFQVDIELSGGGSSALIYRQCRHPEMVLLYRDGKWLWMK